MPITIHLTDQQRTAAYVRRAVARFYGPLIPPKNWPHPRTTPATSTGPTLAGVGRVSAPPPVWELQPRPAPTPPAIAPAVAPVIAEAPVMDVAPLARRRALLG